jgi:hypothetical protein
LNSVIVNYNTIDVKGDFENNLYLYEKQGIFSGCGVLIADLTFGTPVTDSEDEFA